MPNIYGSLFTRYDNSRAKTITCRYNNSTKPLVLSDQNSLWVNEDALLSYGINNSRNVKCCYTELYRPTVKSQNDDGPPFRYGTLCETFWKKENVSVEFVRTNCTNNGSHFYTDFHYFLPIKSRTEKRCENLSKTNDKVNVLILGIDSISRLDFHETMRKTSDYLNDMDAIEMNGYNKVGYGTKHNMVPVATGLFYEELEICMKMGNSYLDSCKFIWKDFELEGYRTAFIEDSEDLAIYEHIGKGFYRSPTDYYSPTFYHAAEKEIGSFQRKVNFCIGTRLLFETLLTYVVKFVSAMVNRPYFSLIWQCTLTHDKAILPQIIDDSYLSLIKNLSLQESFNKTVLILLSDHGFQRYSTGKSSMHPLQQQIPLPLIRLLEDRRPLLIFVFPKWFHSQHLEAISNIKTNSRRLVTPFDLYETLKDLSNHAYYLNEKRLQQRVRHLNIGKLPRGISLFLPVPEMRTCKDADILFTYCSCEQVSRSDASTEYNSIIAQHVIARINEKIAAYPQCSLVFLNKIKYFASEKPKSISKTFTVVNWYMVVVADPGEMIFEASGRNVEGKVRGSNITQLETVVQIVDPISLYRYRSHCVDKKNIKPYCNCRLK